MKKKKMDLYYCDDYTTSQGFVCRACSNVTSSSKDSNTGRIMLIYQHYDTSRGQRWYISDAYLMCNTCYNLFESVFKESIRNENQVHGRTFKKKTLNILKNFCGKREL